MQHDSGLALPIPDRASAEHSGRCAAYIRERIRDAGGSISFAEFMHYALYAPGLGYYSAGTTKFGAGGDFITAPEISGLFARILATQCAAVMRHVDDASVLEFGAGSGRFAADLLAALQELGTPPREYRILEVSADLRERQARLLREELPGLADSVVWLERMPQAHCGVIIANEVLDALPVERFRKKGDRILQLRVADDDGEFIFVEEVAPEMLAAAVDSIERFRGCALPDLYSSEVSLAVPGFIADLAGTLKHGIAFLFDYGVTRREYYSGDRNDGWLRCHFRHRAHSNPLILVGIQDLTAWVDFTAVAESAVANCLDVAGYVSQAQFLINSGLDRELARMAEMPLESQLEMSRQVKLLTLPGEMGENVKCIGLARGELPPLAAFESSDRTPTL